MNVRRLGVVCCSLLVAGSGAGCAVDQAKEVATYRRVLDVPGSPETLQPGQVLTLRDALLLANRHNERLSIEGENYLQALINKKRATAAFLPTLNFAPTYFVQEQVDAPGGGAGGSIAADEQLDVPVTGSVNLFNGFRDVANLRASELTIEQRRALLLDLQASLLLDVARTYFAVLRAEGLVRVLENSIGVQEERLRSIRGRQEAGTARPLDVSQTEALVAEARVALIAARNDARNARSGLKLLTAAPVATSPLVAEYPVPATVAPLEDLRREARARRQDVVAADRAVAAARQGVEVAFGQYYPSISLNLNYFLERDSFPAGAEWSGLLRANVPIFSAGLIEADVRAAWSRHRQAALAASLVRREVTEQVEQSHADLLASEQRLQELQAKLRAARDASIQAEESYGVGLATNLERLTAQDELLRTELQLTGAQFDRTVFYLNLVRTIGGLRDHITTRGPTTPPATQPAQAPRPG